MNTVNQSIGRTNKVNSPIRIGDSVKKEKLCKNEGSIQSFFYWLGLGLFIILP